MSASKYSPAKVRLAARLRMELVTVGFGEFVSKQFWGSDLKTYEPWHLKDGTQWLYIREMHGDKKSSPFPPSTQCFVPTTAAIAVILLKLSPIPLFPRFHRGNRCLFLNSYPHHCRGKSENPFPITANEFSTSCKILWHRALPVDLFIGSMQIWSTANFWKVCFSNIKTTNSPEATSQHGEEGTATAGNKTNIM